MKRKLTAIFTALTMFMGFISIQPCLAEAEAVNENAAGTDLETGSAIEISTLAELEAFRDSVNSGDTYEGLTIKLTADIDMSGKYGADIGGKKVSWTPIGISYEKSFRGIFDGGGHEVKGLYINTSENYQGLFGFTYGAEIKNISVSGNVYGGWMVGGIAGYNQEGLMENCHNSAAVTGGWPTAYYAGGITGRNDGTVKKCSNIGSIVGSGGSTGTGGIAGVNNTNILDCSNSGSISGDSAVGGIVGENAGVVENCHNTGIILANEYIGGIAGMNEDDVKYCSNEGSVSGIGNGGNIGGITGYNYLSEFCSVANCYNIADVKGFFNVGGITGDNYAGVYECYNTGTVADNGTATGDEAESEKGRIGGITGSNHVNVIICYNTGIIKGESGYAGGISGENSSEGIVAGCYNTGDVLGNNKAGGVIGYSNSGSSVENCYYLKDTAEGGINGQDTVNALQKSTADFANQLTFYNWDFNAEWEMSNQLGRPVLRSNKEIAFMLGDLDGDGLITTDDALIILQYVAGFMNLNSGMQKNADVNADSKITTDDALNILKKSAGLIDHFKVNIRYSIK